MADFLKIMQQAQQMQSRLQNVQDELGRMSVTGSAGGGMVTAEADGRGCVRRIRIDPAVVNPSDIEMLEDLVVAAVGDAQKRATEAAKAKMGALDEGMNLLLPLLQQS